MDRIDTCLRIDTHNICTPGFMSIRDSIENETAKYFVETPSNFTKYAEGAHWTIF